jgi:hypothetical protein
VKGAGNCLTRGPTVHELGAGAHEVGAAGGGEREDLGAEPDAEFKC